MCQYKLNDIIPHNNINIHKYIYKYIHITNKYIIYIERERERKLGKERYRGTRNKAGQKRQMDLVNGQSKEPT